MVKSDVFVVKKKMDFAIVLPSPEIKARTVGLCQILGCNILQSSNYTMYLGPSCIKFVYEPEWRLVSNLLSGKGIYHLATVGMYF